MACWVCGAVDVCHLASILCHILEALLDKVSALESVGNTVGTARCGYFFVLFFFGLRHVLRLL